MTKFYVYHFQCHCDMREDVDVTILAFDEESARDELAGYLRCDGLDYFVMKIDLVHVIEFEGLIAL